ncbi:hypothetical protein ADK70_35455 [Streptomyces rimosus subsp. pseudoverticillatus]|nr:hypothetical protein ADK70_35455 [Streptomyces rimosus subsp. pseudoverticillatus]
MRPVPARSAADRLVRDLPQVPAVFPVGHRPVSRAGDRATPRVRGGDQYVTGYIGRLDHTGAS